MKTPKKDSQTMTVSLNPEPKGEFKILGGSRSDDWNLRLSNLLVADAQGPRRAPDRTHGDDAGPDA
jgi:hypothetical protein